MKRRVVQWWKKTFSRKKLQPVNPNDTLVDIITKMLLDNECTVNKKAMEELASFIASFARSALDEGVAGIDKVRQQIDFEEGRWKNPKDHNSPM